MQDLRLIGVDDDGGHVLLADGDGARFRLPLDESLRAAARRDRPRLGQLQIEIEGGMRPRDVQAMVRAGMTAEEVAERSGWTVEKVHKYEGPILAEREYVAGLGQAVRLRQRGGSRMATSLGHRVTDRLTERGVSTDTIEWDAWRREGPEWTVVVTFAAGGRQRQATWAFDVPNRSLHARDDEARWLSEDEPAAGPLPSEAPVYDIEADGGLQAARRHPRSDDPVDLVTAMRERSAARNRRGSARRRQLEPVAALPLDDDVSDTPLPAEGDIEEPQTQSAAQQDAPGSASPEIVDLGPDDVDAASGEPLERAASLPPALLEGKATPPTPSDGPAEPGADDLPAAPAAPAARHRPRRSGRPSVPSWDDIVFGTKTKNPDT